MSRRVAARLRGCDAPAPGPRPKPPALICGYYAGNKRRCGDSRRTKQRLCGRGAHRQVSFLRPGFAGCAAAPAGRKSRRQENSVLSRFGARTSNRLQDSTAACCDRERSGCFLFAFFFFFAGFPSGGGWRGPGLHLFGLFGHPAPQTGAAGGFLLTSS